MDLASKTDIKCGHCTHSLFHYYENVDSENDNGTDYYFCKNKHCHNYAIVSY